MLYDPPSGWMYGFPRPYNPRESETLSETLLRDGYPQDMLKQITRDDGSLIGVRFWSDRGNYEDRIKNNK